MNWVAMRGEIAEITRNAVEDYASMSDMDAWDAPESWIQCEIARKLRDRFFIMVEAGVNRLIEWHISRYPEIEKPASEIRSGRIDVALFEKTADQPPVGLIEVKKYGQRGACAEDVIRLRGLGRYLKLHSALIVAHIEFRTENSRQNAIKNLLADSQTLEAHASVVTFEFDTSYCAAVVLEVMS